MNETKYVRLCPFCSEHPAYLEKTLQCVDCGVFRPKRVITIAWEGGSPEEQSLAQDALDLQLHSAQYIGSGKARLTRVSARQWQVDKEEIVSPPESAPDKKDSRLWLLPGNVKSALERAGLSVAP